MAYKSLTCPLCKDKLHKHDETYDCLSRWAFLADGRQHETAGCFSRKKLDAILNKYKERIVKGYAKGISDKKLLDRLQVAIDDEWDLGYYDPEWVISSFSLMKKEMTKKFKNYDVPK